MTERYYPESSVNEMLNDYENDGIVGCPQDYPHIELPQSNWHTGTPTEEGDYLVKLDVEHHVYPYYVLKWNKRGWYSHYDMDYPACPQHSVLKWQKIEED